MTRGEGPIRGEAFQVSIGPVGVLPYWAVGFETGLVWIVSGITPSEHEIAYQGSQSITYWGDHGNP